MGVISGVAIVKRVIIAATAACFMFAGVCMGQSSLGLAMKFEHTSLLQYEPVHAVVAVKNTTALPFEIGPADELSDTRLEIVVSNVSGRDVLRTDDNPPVKRLRIGGGQTREVMLDISKQFDLSRAGRYLCSVRVTWRGRVYESRDRMFEVVDGIVLVRKSAALETDPTISRTYTLRYWPRERGEYIFLRVDGEEGGYNYGVFELGPLIRVHAPTLEILPFGKLEVRHQSGIDRFSRSQFRVLHDQVFFLDQSYEQRDGGAYPKRSSSRLKFGGDEQ